MTILCWSAKLPTLMGRKSLDSMSFDVLVFCQRDEEEIEE
jgi:hypothetical protein